MNYNNGLKIKNIKSATLYEYNLGIRDRYEYTNAMFNDSLFSRYIIKNGLNIYKNISTRDIVCLEFEYGTRSYEENYKYLNEILEKNENNEKYKNLLNELIKNKDKYVKKTKEQIREEYYVNGVDIKYLTKNKNDNSKQEEIIHYKMLYRSSSKAKIGQVMFINEKLYDKAYNWLTMNIGNLMNKDNAKIVEISAYAPLTTSTIVDILKIPIDDVLILKDQDSFFETMANIVKSKTYYITKKIVNEEKTEINRQKSIETGKKFKKVYDKINVPNKKCVVSKEKTKIKNTLWDGMGLIENSIMPKDFNGMVLLRNHFFKMCGFRTNIQLFFKDYCRENNINYETFEVEDMFGYKHKIKDIKIITTNNAIKWIKFSQLMGNNNQLAYKYWCDKIKKDGNIFGVVKTDHPSKLGNFQQLSYQMINTLPCEYEDVVKLSQHSVDYVEKIKADNDEFEIFLRKNKTEVNHYEMLADLYRHNKEFAKSKWFRYEKRQIIRTYVNHLRKGKIVVNGDNLTVCGNPYALLLYSVNANWEQDPTLNVEKGLIQCYTKRFKDNEKLCAIRNPHNSPNNISYLKNTYSKEMEKYFDFSENIIAVNCIGTDIQDRMNGMDFDSDFVLATNNEIMVKCAKRCYEEYPTIVNSLKESGITYSNSLLEYAQMDNKFAKSRIGIGWSSNLAQLAMTYYWTEKSEELYNNFIILSVLAQVIIDGCKREYEVDGIKEINRIQKMSCMNRTFEEVLDNGKIKTIRRDFPKFMKYTKEIQYTKNGIEIPYENIKNKKDKINKRIDMELICPMNWLQDILNGIKATPNNNAIDTGDFFIKMYGSGHYRQMTKIRQLVSNYDDFVKNNKNDESKIDEVVTKFKELVEQLQKIRVGNIVTINRLIELSLHLESDIGRPNIKQDNIRYTRKMLNSLYKMNKKNFLINFIKQE